MLPQKTRRVEDYHPSSKGWNLIFIMPSCKTCILRSASRPDGPEGGVLRRLRLTPSIYNSTFVTDYEYGFQFTPLKNIIINNMKTIVSRPTCDGWVMRPESWPQTVKRLFPSVENCAFPMDLAGLVGLTKSFPSGIPPPRTSISFIWIPSERYLRLHPSSAHHFNYHVGL